MEPHQISLQQCGELDADGIEEISEAEFDATIAINLKSEFDFIQPVAPHMLKAGGGRIANMSSLNTHTGGVTAAVSRFGGHLA